MMARSGGRAVTPAVLDSKMGMRDLLAAIVAWSLVAPTSGAQPVGEHRRVLVLYSTRRDAEFSLIGERELPRILDQGLARNIDFHSEFIDLARFPEPDYKIAFQEFLALKYQKVRFDLVVAMQDAALEFVGRYRDTLFRETPAVFLTNTRVTDRPRNSTGLVHERNFAATIDLIRRLQPDVRQLFVVTGAAAVDKQFEHAVQQQLQDVGDVPAVTYLSALPTEQLIARLSHLPAQSAVYHILVSEDGAGHTFHPLEYVDRVAAASNAPTYCWVDSAMDHGIVGGNVYSQIGAIDRVGELALRVLRGEPAESISIERLQLNADTVDWRQLRRWRIDEARVPPGAIVRFRDPTVWDRYRIYILGALTLLVTQTVLIAGLLIQRQRRRRAETALHRSFERNRDLAGRLLNAQEVERARISGELHDDICQRMMLLTIELEALDRANPGGPPAAALGAAQDITRSLHDLSHRLHPTRLRVIGLVPALERLCMEVSHAGAAVTFEHDNVPATLARHVALCVYRVVQEGLQNALKHSNAAEISVRLCGGSSGLTLTISDGGDGFDVETALEKGIGLMSMIERVEAVGGSLEIRSSRGAGTRLIATLP